MHIMSSIIFDLDVGRCINSGLVWQILIGVITVLRAVLFVHYIFQLRQVLNSCKVEELPLLFSVYEKIYFDLLFFQIILPTDYHHHSGHEKCQAQACSSWSQHLNCEDMVNSNCDNWFETCRDVSDKLGENLIDENVAYNKVQTQHD